MAKSPIPIFKFSYIRVPPRWSSWCPTPELWSETNQMLWQPSSKTNDKIETSISSHTFYWYFIRAVWWFFWKYFKSAMMRSLYEMIQPIWKSLLCSAITFTRLKHFRILIHHLIRKMSYRNYQLPYFFHPFKKLPVLYDSNVNHTLPSLNIRDKFFGMRSYTASGSSGEWIKNTPKPFVAVVFFFFT